MVSDELEGGANDFADILVVQRDVYIRNLDDIIHLGENVMDLLGALYKKSIFPSFG
jgi:hypothetical protein